jgi:ribosomal protein S19
MLKSNKHISKTHKLSYISSSTWRQIFLIKDNELHKKKERFLYDRSSTISPIFNGMKVNIYTGNRFISKYVNRWMVGFKYGEFTWNRKMALYKAKQLKKKKKK